MTTTGGFSSGTLSAELDDTVDCGELNSSPEEVSFELCTDSEPPDDRSAEEVSPREEALRVSDELSELAEADALSALDTFSELAGGDTLCTLEELGGLLLLETDLSQPDNSKTPNIAANHFLFTVIPPFISLVSV